MSNLITMAFQTVLVTWTEGNNWTFDPSGFLVRNQNVTIFVYTLGPASTPGVTFSPKTPIVWNQPSTQPANLGYGLVGKSADLCLTDLNTAKAGSSEAYSFFLQVEFQGTTYQSPDPTIVNTEPPHFVPIVTERIERIERPSLAA
jgi:hypothetical protein